MNPRAKSMLSALEGYHDSPLQNWTRLRKLLERHADSEFGRTYGFSGIRSPEDFREAVPVMDYEAHRPWIERAAGGETRVLACDEPLGFERTSGTSAREKWIPVTAGLQEEFARGLASWFSGWKTRCPEVFAGRAYWAVSPPGMAPATTTGGHPLGMTNDAAYFPLEVGARLADWLVVPDLSGEAEAVFEETATALLGGPGLSVVSVWSPTFLLGIDAALRRLRGEFKWRDVWPELALVSCWADASSAQWIPRLRERLGGIPIEAKGLLATEGITTVPGGTDGRARLAGECHWHEFLDEAGKIVRESEVRPGVEYEVLMTTAGGLFRYRSGDRVKVTGRGADGMARLCFVGRAGSFSDLVGEKLHEIQVVEALAGSGACGFLVADASRPGYELWLDDPSLAEAFEILLRRNPYFDQALVIRQLAPLVIRRLDVGWNVRLTSVLARRRGCRMGDVKLPGLFRDETPEEVASWLA